MAGGGKAGVRRPPLPPRAGAPRGRRPSGARRRLTARPRLVLPPAARKPRIASGIWTEAGGRCAGRGSRRHPGPPPPTCDRAAVSLCQAGLVSARRLPPPPPAHHQVSRPTCIGRSIQSTRGSLGLWGPLASADGQQVRKGLSESEEAVLFCLLAGFADG
jgi:hypothetical protein